METKELSSFVEQLVEQTRLTQRQAQVYTLRRCKHSRESIAERFGISTGAVDSHYSSARDIASSQLTTKQLHFYRTDSGRVPLDWQSWFATDRVSYVLSNPRLDLINSDVVTLESDVLFLTVFQGNKIESDTIIRDGAAQHIPLNDDSVEEIGRALRMIFSKQLGKEEALVFESAYENFVGEGVSRRDLYQTVFQGQSFTFSDAFLATVDGETRFIAFLESDNLSSYRQRFLLGQSLETSRPICLDDFEFDGWLSIVGKIGSGKSFTLDLVLSQIAREGSVSVVEFNPFVNERASIGQYESHPQEETSELDEDVVDKWFDSVFEYIERDDNTVYAIADEAHYLIRERPERFGELVELAVSNDDVRLITATQTFVEFVDAVEGMEEIMTSGSWLFHRMGTIKNKSPLTISERVKRLDVGSHSGGAGALLVDGESDQGFEFVVSLDGFDA